MTSPNSSSTPLFISYSRKDKPWLERLQTHLEPLVQEGDITTWDDTHLKGGEDWPAEISKALSRARVAVLLVSADFLASAFIRDHELPVLLDAAQARGLRILPLIVGHCLYAESRLDPVASVNDPKIPLETLKKADSDEILRDLARSVVADLAAGSGEPGKAAKGQALSIRLHTDGDALVATTAHGERRSSLDALESQVRAGDKTALFQALFGDQTPPPRHLHLACADATAAALPWHCLQHDPGVPLVHQGWGIECVRNPEPPANAPHNLTQVLIIAPSSDKLAPSARAHTDAMENALRALLPERKACIDRADTPARLKAALRRDPDLVYVYAQVHTDARLVLGESETQAFGLSPEELVRELRALAVRPVLWVHYIERGTDPLLDPARILPVDDGFPLVMLQRSEAWTAPQGHERAQKIAWSLAGQTQPSPAAALAEAPHESFVWLQERPGLTLTSRHDKDARLRAQIHAALIRQRLGRQQQRNQIGREIDKTLDRAMRLFAVGGSRSAHPGGLADQLIFDLDTVGDQHSPTRVIKHSLSLTLDTTLAQRHDTQAMERSIFDCLDLGLLLSVQTPKVALIGSDPEAAPDERLILLLAWHIEIPDDMEPTDLSRWVNAWGRIHAHIFGSDQIPDRGRLIGGACLQWPDTWLEQHQTDARDITALLDEAFEEVDSNEIRSIRYLDPLDLLTARDLRDFFLEFNKIEGSCTRGRDLKVLARWTHASTDGRFEPTVDHIYRHCKNGFSDCPDAHPHQVKP